MSRKNNPLSKRASLSLIAADTKFFRDFALDPYPEDFRSAAVLALMPFLSAFAYESVRYFERTYPTAGYNVHMDQATAYAASAKAGLFVYHGVSRTGHEIVGGCRRMLASAEIGRD